MEQIADRALWALDTLKTKLQPGTDEFWMVVAPVAAYWAVSGYFDLLDHSTHPFVLKHRVTRIKRGRENPVTRLHVFLRVLLQHFLQVLVGLAVMLAEPDHCDTVKPVDWLHTAVKFVMGMFIMDAWQYWIHRAVHVNTWLYKHVHSVHHRLLIPYAFGALYNHPVEAIILDTLGAGIAMFSCNMTCQLGTAFFTFSTIKTVLDHCNYRVPLNPFHDLFPNSAAYHDVHHDIRGIKMNFSQPFFTFWDHLCGTYLDPTSFHYSQVRARRHRALLVMLVCMLWQKLFLEVLCLCALCGVRQGARSGGMCTQPAGVVRKGGVEAPSGVGHKPDKLVQVPAMWHALM